MTGRRTLIKAIAVLAGVGSVAGVAVAATSAPPAPPPAVPELRTAQTIVAVDATQAATLGILRRPIAAGDAVPAAVLDLVARGTGPSLGANPALARRALSTALGEQLYVVPARGWVCLASSVANSNCTPTTAIADGFGVALQGIPSGYRLRGLVPDGVDRVEVRGDGGQTAMTATGGNAWTVDVAFTPSSVAWTGPAGERVVPVSAPPPEPLSPAPPPSTLAPDAPAAG